MRAIEDIEDGDPDVVLSAICGPRSAVGKKMLRPKNGSQSSL